MCENIITDDENVNQNDAEIIEDNQQNDKEDIDKEEWSETIEDEKEKFFDAKENNQEDVNMLEEDISITKGGNLLEKSTDAFDRELFIDLLESLYPTLRDEIVYCSPEMIWFKIKQVTGVDINIVLEIYNKYHNEETECETCKEKKKNLKRKFIDSIYPDCNNKHCRN